MGVGGRSKEAQQRILTSEQMQREKQCVSLSCQHWPVSGKGTLMKAVRTPPSQYRGEQRGEDVRKIKPRSNAERLKQTDAAGRGMHSAAAPLHHGDNAGNTRQ